MLLAPLQQPRVRQVIGYGIRRGGRGIGRRKRDGERRLQSDVLGEVEFGSSATEAEGGRVVRPRCLFGSLERAQPHPRRLVGIPDLRRPFSPRPLADAAVLPSRLASLRLFRVGGSRGGLFHGCCRNRVS